MSGYADEVNMGTTGWKPETFGEFDFTHADGLLTNKLAFDGFKTEEEKIEAVHRLATIASKSGAVAARAALAQFGGIDISDARKFTKAVNSEIDNIDVLTRNDVLLLAREKRDSGDYLRYLALSGSIGIYPPENGDSVIVQDIYYDSKHDFRIGSDTHFIGATGNSG